MTERDSIELEVSKWSAWAPGLEEACNWREWAKGSLAAAGEAEPDVRFVEALLRRRLSPMSRMAFRVASDCLDDPKAQPTCIFCSRYGEFARAYELLCTLAREEQLSPNAFSLSVHNTASSLFSIWRNDKSHSSALAAGEATLEAGFLEAWSVLSDGAASSALVVYHDQPLPAPYSEQETTVEDSAALALLLRLPTEEDSGAKLRLTWHAGSSDGNPSPGRYRNPALQVLKLLLAGGEPVLFDTGRLSWEWSRHGTAI